jgi:hypothetical protein
MDNGNSVFSLVQTCLSLTSNTALNSELSDVNINVCVCVCV